MKLNRTYLFIAVSSISLLILLIIQVNWIFRTAHIKEELFNEKANMVLSKTTEALYSDKEVCRSIEACAEEVSSPETTPILGQHEILKIDSLLNYYMKFYNFRIGYSFEVVKPGPHRAKYSLASYIYNMPLEELSVNNNIELKLLFPDKKQYIIAEMGPLFITSVVLILVVLILFWRTVLSLMKEKEISEHTTDFLNNMTHEFKTPLTNIALAGKMITRDATIHHEDKVRHYSDIILEENEKLRLQVEQVLSMTALERGEIPLQKKEIDLHQVIRDTLKCISVQIESRQGHVELSLDAGRSMLTGDQVHLTNAFCNLVDNAVKYSGEIPGLSIHTFNRDQYLIVILSDNGIGISGEYQQKVFDKFFRVPTGDVHDVKGFGLGLAYVKKIIELHKGTIDLESEKGKGTTFTITLPNA